MSSESNIDLHEEVSHLRTILNNVGAYVFTKDIDGRYTFANEMVCQLFGIPLQDLLGQTDEKFFDLSVSDELRRNDLAVITKGEVVETEETNFIARTGENRTYWTVKIPLFDQAGAITGLCGISTDITDRIQLEQQLVEQKELLDTVLNNIGAYIYMKDADRRYLYANPPTAELFGVSQGEIQKKKDEDFLLSSVAQGFARLDEEVLATGKTACAEETFRNSAGEERYYWSTKIPLLKNGIVQSLVGISSDITEVIKLREKFKHQASHDPLTQLMNRRGFIRKTEKEFLRSERYQSPLGLAIIDIDNFKKINDEKGHVGGDEVLVQFSQLLSRQIRSTDLLGRWGGEEFILALPELSENQLKSAGEKIRDSVEKSIFLNGEVKVTCSIGIAERNKGESFDDVLKRADDALFLAKGNGRNQVRSIGSN